MPTWAVESVVVVGAAHLAAYFAGHERLAGVLKALPILLVATLAAAHGTPYARWIAVALCFGAVGDVCLLSPDRFVAGLASFLVGHLCYLTAFLGTGGAVTPDVSALVVLGVGAGGLLAVLWRHLAASLKAPVVVYVVVITAMAWAAMSRATTPGTPEPSGVLAAAGAVSFVVSDGILALDRFARRIPAGHGWVMLTYYAGQTMLAASALASG